ncbi:MAG: hypothetical protein F4160_11490 [Rhodospirillaceae bacterium]|nr:hypothetical protein [Rhodospirillaceae bacterium]
MNSGTVDLIYLDPPFNSNRTYSAPIGSQAAGAAFKDAWTFDDADRVYLALLQERDPTTFAIIDAARLAHGKGMAAYLGMMAQRLVEMRRVLKPAGSIYLHCDDTAGAYLRMLMDSVFGQSQFQAQITWRRTFAHNDKMFGAVSDYLLWYSLGEDHIRNIEAVVVPFSEGELEGKYPHRDRRGRHLRDNLMGPGTTDGESGQAWKGCDPTKYGRCWSAPKTGKYARYLNDVLLPGYLDIAGVHDRLNALDDAGMIHWTSGGAPLLKRYAMPGQGTVPGNIWTDIPPLARKTKERVGYPTQKPLALLQRIIRASSNEGDTVLDPFCGCATAAVAAERLQRQWIGIDISAKAAELVTTRLQGILDEIPLYKTGDVVHRTDQPGRTDLGDLPHYRTHLDSLYGAQEGFCGGCGEHFRKRNLTVDHIVPRAHGGTDHVENLWLLCAACNSSKGTRSQEQFLKERMQKRAALFPWLVD